MYLILTIVTFTFDASKWKALPLPLRRYAAARSGHKLAASPAGGGCPHTHALTSSIHEPELSLPIHEAASSWVAFVWRCGLSGT